MMLVRNGQLLTTLRTAGSQNATTILCCHTLTETMLVHATAIVRLKCSFHCLIIFFYCYYSISDCKSTHYFPITQVFPKKLST